MVRLKTANPMGYIKALVLYFKGTRETWEGLEQDDRVALKLPSGERIQSGLGRSEGAGGHGLFQAGPRRGRRGQARALLSEPEMEWSIHRGGRQGGGGAGSWQEQRPRRF